MSLPHKCARLIVVAALWLAGCGGSGGGTTTTTPPVTQPVTTPTGPVVDAAVYSTAPGATLATAAEITSVTHHTIVINGATLNYTATAGHMTALGLTSKAPEASFFYIAYTLDGQNAATRPVTFFYNGGPGSATVWLHLGSFSPKRLVTGDPSTATPMPFPLVDNADSMIDITDMVFVDAVGTGYSEAIVPNTNQTFWGVDEDAAVFRDFVMRYLAVNTRNASPKFLFGESYGTTRSAVLVNVLETVGVTINGVVLQSSVLNYSTNCGVITGTVSCAGYIPTYGTVGAYYKLLSPNPADLPTYAAQMRTFTVNTYTPADNAFLASNVLPGATLVAQLANMTGLSAAAWAGNLNIDPNTYQFGLIPNTLIGRYDARVSAPFGSALASQDDPSSTFVSPSFAAGIASYLTSSLLYVNTSTYVLLSNAINTWDFSHDGLGLPDTIPDIAAAMALNPKLKILSLNGYHDLATPFFQTELDLARLGANPNVLTRFYSGGHMTYLDDISRPLEKADIVQFYQSALVAQ